MAAIVDNFKKVVNFVGGVPVGHAHIAQNVVQRQLVSGANQLDDHHRRRQDGSAAQKALLFGLVRHEKNTSNP